MFSKPAQIAGVVLAVLWGSGAHAQSRPLDAETPPEGIVWRVLNEINTYFYDIDDPTNRPPLVTQVPDGVLTPVEINGDGLADWLISWPQEIAFCGTGGCARTLYVSGAPIPGAEDQATGFTRALDRQALELSIETVAGEVRLEALVHHALCADGRSECRFAWAWDEGARRLVQRPSSDGRTAIQGFGVAPVDDVDPSTAWLPSELATVWEDSKLVCPASWEATGYEVLRAEINSIPDINGDGRLDWLAALPAPCDSGSALRPPQVWVTAGEEAVVLAWQAASGDVEVNLDRQPATLTWLTDCGAMTGCARQPLRWDSAGRTLRP